MANNLRVAAYILTLCLTATCLGPRTFAQDLAAEQVYDVRSAGENGVKLPKAVYRTDPEYTERARKKKIRGSVVLSVIVTKEGNVRDAKITTSLDKDLDQQALNAVNKWQFEPATKDGKPVPIRMSVEVSFNVQ